MSFEGRIKRDVYSGDTYKVGVIAHRQALSPVRPPSNNDPRAALFFQVLSVEVSYEVWTNVVRPAVQAAPSQGGAASSASSRGPLLSAKEYHIKKVWAG